MLRLRQIALVATDLASAEAEVTSALGVRLCFRDPGVGVFGLHNALFPVGDQFLEVVSPTREGTTAGRQLAKRGGDGGYMVLVQTDDLAGFRQRFADPGVRVAYEAGDVIFREDARDDAFFVLLDGLVQLSRGGLPLADLSAGAHFGEMAMVDKAPRSATATALVGSRALVIQRARFYELLRAEPVMAVKLTWSFIQVLNTRLRMTSRELIARPSPLPA